MSDYQSPPPAKAKSHEKRMEEIDNQHEKHVGLDAELKNAKPIESYLRQYQRAFIAGVENLWTKYAVTAKQIIADRDKESAQLNAYLKELGYE